MVLYTLQHHIYCTHYQIYTRPECYMAHQNTKTPANKLRFAFILSRQYGTERSFLLIIIPLS